MFRSIGRGGGLVCLTALAFGAVALSGCAVSGPPDERRCIEMVGAGQHSHRMVKVPCNPEAQEQEYLPPT